MAPLEATQTIVFEGILREPNLERWFYPMVDEVHQRAVDQKLREVVIDLRRLEYANAAAWKGLVYWLRRLREDPAAVYRIRIRANEAHRWQRVGMPSLQVFGQDRLIIESIGEGPIE
jgi:hypothetical protein